MRAKRYCLELTVDPTSTDRTAAKHNDEVQFYAFDILVADGEDVRKLPLSMRNFVPTVRARRWHLPVRTSSRRSVGISS